MKIWSLDLSATQIPPMCCRVYGEVCDVHVVVALDHLGRRLGELSVPTTAKGYESLVRWAEGFGAP